MIARKWQLNDPTINVSSSSRSLTPIVPPEFKPQNFYETAVMSQLTFNTQPGKNFQFASEAYIQFGLQLIDSTNGTTYPNGAPVALAPSLAANMFDRWELRHAGEIVQQIASNQGFATFFMNCVNYSFDYLQSGAYQQTLFLLDAAGETQDFNGIGVVASGAQLPTNAPLIPAAGAYVPARGYVIAFANNSSGTGPVYTLDGSGITRANTSGALTSTNVGASSTAGGYYPVILQSSTDNTNFWLRQALTNQPGGPAAPGNGVITQCRINLVDFLPVYQSNPIWQKYDTWQLITYTPSNISCMVNHAQYYPGTNATVVPDAKVWLKYLHLMMPTEQPSKYLADQYDKILVPGATFPKVYNDVAILPVGTIASGGNSFVQAFNLTAGLVDWLTFMFVPTSYLTDQKQDRNVSIVPQVSNGECILSTGQINYQQENFPSIPYGQQLSDNVRMYETWLSLSSRTNVEMWGPCVNFQQFLQNYFFLTFDLRGRAGSSATVATIVQPNLVFKNNFSVATTVFGITIKKQKGEDYVVSRGDDISSVVMGFRKLI